MIDNICLSEFILIHFVKTEFKSGPIFRNYLTKRKSVEQNTI